MTLHDPFPRARLPLSERLRHTAAIHNRNGQEALARAAEADAAEARDMERRLAEMAPAPARQWHASGGLVVIEGGKR